MTHICFSNLTIIGSDNDLSPGRRQAIIWTNDDILLSRTFRTHFSEIISKTHTFSFKKMHVKMSSGKWRPSCLGLNVLIKCHLKDVNKGGCWSLCLQCLQCGVLLTDEWGQTVWFKYWWRVTFKCPCSVIHALIYINLTGHVSRSAAVAGAAISVHCHVVSVQHLRRSDTRRWNLSGLPGSRMKRPGGGACDGRRVACAV